jgi:hypothetical protein
MKKTYFKLFILAGAMIMTISSCKEKKETPTPEPTPTPPTEPCFNSNSNGTYTAGIGSIQSGTAVTSFTGGVVTINRTACHEVNMTLSTYAGNKTETITNITLNSNSVYEGSVSTGTMSMSFGSHINAQAPGSFTVIANK